ncbi:MAG: ShlB/FhaC/HecB family hemolysin secretion/activation protein [Xylophilus ampelinus]
MNRNAVASFRRTARAAARARPRGPRAGTARRLAPTAFAAALWLASPATAQAQQAAPVQGGNPLATLPGAPGQQPPAVEPDLRLRVTPAPPAADDLLAREVVPRRFDIAGVRSVPFEDVAKIFVPLSGQSVTVARIVEVGRAVTALYQQRGFALSFAFVPPQDFRDGAVRVVVVEGHIRAVAIEGDAGPAEPRLRALAAEIVRDKPLRTATFDRYTQLMSRLPGVTVGAQAAQPTTTDGGTELKLTVRRQPYNVSLGADLRQPTPRGVLSGQWNDPIPFLPGGQLSASALLGDFQKERFGNLAYSQLVGDEGLTLRAAVSHYRGRPDVGATSPLLRREVTNRRLDLGASYPWLLDRNRALTFSGGFYAADNADEYRNRLTGAALAEDVRVRALTAQAAWVATGATRSRSATVSVSQGIDGLGASAENRINFAGVPAANPARLDFSRIAFDAAQRDRHAGRWGTALSAAGQYSPHIVPVTERVSFGGSRFGRGYAPGEIAGDAGLGVAGEVNRAVPLDGGRWLQQLEPYLLLEAARVHSRLAPARDARLRSVALGLRLTDNRHYALDLAAAKPTGDPSPNNPERRIRLSLLLSYQFDAP